MNKKCFTKKYAFRSIVLYTVLYQVYSRRMVDLWESFEYGVSELIIIPASQC